jgi:hypothetical protein
MTPTENQPLCHAETHTKPTVPEKENPKQLDCHDKRQHSLPWESFNFGIL